MPNQGYNYLVVDHRKELLEFYPFVYDYRFLREITRQQKGFIQLAIDRTGYMMLKLACEKMKADAGVVKVQHNQISTKRMETRLSLFVENFPVKEMLKDKHNQFEIKWLKEKAITEIDFFTETFLRTIVTHWPAFGYFLEEKEFNIQCLLYNPKTGQYDSEQPPLILPAQQKPNRDN
jgi:hypothetical protein